MKAIRFKSLPVRLVCILFAVVVTYFSVKVFLWCFASSASINASVKEVGDLLVSISPADPQTHFARAAVYEKTFETDDLQIALREYETAAALAPNNYLLWLSLGSTYGRVGDNARAEAAFRRAKELAPNYSQVNWALGNFLLREGNDDEGYAELRKAVSGDSKYAASAASTALQFSDGDLDLAHSRLAGIPSFEVAFSVLLADQKELNKALEIWNKIEPQAKDDKYLDAYSRLRSLLIDQKRFTDAITLIGPAKETGPDEAAVGKISNPGFEGKIVAENPNIFDWRVFKGTYPQVAVTDAQKHSGNYSLIVVLSGSEFREFRGVSQTVAVRPGAAYQLKINYRSDVNSKVQFFWEVASAKDGKRISISAPLQPSLQWAISTVDFQVPGDIDGVDIRFLRGECIAAACSASGSFWFDDLELIQK